MDKEYFFTKLDDVKKRLINLGGKFTGRHHKHPKREGDQDRINLDEEIRFYEKEHPTGPQEKVLRESGGQDISAI